MPTAAVRLAGSASIGIPREPGVPALRLRNYPGQNGCIDLVHPVIPQCRAHRLRAAKRDPVRHEPGRVSIQSVHRPRRKTDACGDGTGQIQPDGRLQRVRPMDQLSASLRNHKQVWRLVNDTAFKTVGFGVWRVGRGAEREAVGRRRVGEWQCRIRSAGDPTDKLPANIKAVSRGHPDISLDPSPVESDLT